MGRLFLFEFHDYSWVPPFIRQSVVESLGASIRWSSAYQVALPFFVEFVEKSQAVNILDLCSGSGDAISILLSGLNDELAAHIEVTLSDLNPNIPLLREVTKNHPMKISVIQTPVDATDVPASINCDGYTVISALHHFRPLQAEGLLQGCVQQQRAVFILEPMTRRLDSWYRLGFFYFLGMLCNPFRARKHKMLKGLFTYIFPVIPFVCLWDGAVSLLRTYTRAEIKEMTMKAGCDYQWQYCEIPVRWKGSIQLLMGLPREARCDSPPQGSSTAQNAFV